MRLPAVTSEIVSLPGGLALRPDCCLRRAELRQLSGREEDWLTRHPNAPAAVAVTHLLKGCLVDLDGRNPDAELVRQLLVGDRDFLMLALRSLTLGDAFQAVALCSSCHEKMDIGFGASEVPMEFATGPSQPEYELTLEGAEGPREIRFRLPTGGDQEAVLGLEMETARRTLFDRCVLSDGGAPLTLEESEQVEAAIERVAPRIDLELDVVCPNCGAAFVLPFDTTAFFLQEMRSEGRALLREFHALAFHYHWSEAEILALDRGRRRAYLSLLSDELSRA